jgi:hypothetical protein
VFFGARKPADRCRKNLLQMKLIGGIWWPLVDLAHLVFDPGVLLSHSFQAGVSDEKSLCEFRGGA